MLTQIFINFHMIIKTKLSIKVIIIVLFTSIFVSCSKNSDKIDNVQELDIVLSELMVVENMSISDSLKAVLIDKKLKEKDITINEIRRHISAHKENSIYWKDTYNRIKQIIKEN